MTRRPATVTLGDRDGTSSVQMNPVVEEEHPWADGIDQLGRRIALGQRVQHGPQGRRRSVLYCWQVVPVGAILGLSLKSQLRTWCQPDNADAGPVQLSATSQSPADRTADRRRWLEAVRRTVAPAPVQLSATSQTPAEARQVVVAGWKPSAGQARRRPVQLSATSQTPGRGAADRRRRLEAVRRTGARRPVQLSAPSQTPPFEVPVQVVVAGWKPSAGQAARRTRAALRHVALHRRGAADRRRRLEAVHAGAGVPVQESAPSQAPPFEVPGRSSSPAGSRPPGRHPTYPCSSPPRRTAPAEARQIVVAGLKPSTAGAGVPVQESVPSQTPPFEVPVQVVVAGWKPSAGQRTRRTRAALRHVALHRPRRGRSSSRPGSRPRSRAGPSQESAPSQTPPFEVPVQAVVDGWKPSAGQAPDVPLQLSATSHAPAEARQIGRRRLEAVHAGAGARRRSPSRRRRHRSRSPCRPSSRAGSRPPDRHPTSRAALRHVARTAEARQIGGRWLEAVHAGAGVPSQRVRPVADATIRGPRAGRRRGLEAVRRAGTRRPGAALRHVARHRPRRGNRRRCLEAVRRQAPASRAESVHVAGATVRGPRAGRRRGLEAVRRTAHPTSRCSSPPRRTHRPRRGRSVVAGLKPSAGQASPIPSQLSATSQTPSEARAGRRRGWKPSAGQALE